MPLTIARCRTLGPGFHGDGNGLYLRVRETGARNWIQRLVVRGKRTDIGLGAFPLVPLAQARELAFENRRQARRGLDLLAERRRRVPTFREAADAKREQLAATWKGSQTAAIWDGQMALHVFPKIGDKPVNEVGREDVLGILTPLWTDKPAGARRLRGAIRQVLEWAQAAGHVEVNMADVVVGALGKGPAPKKHRALPYGEMATMLADVDRTNAARAVKLCLRFIVLTGAVRSGEARGARWDEVDTKARTWTIPESRMKMKDKGGDHRVPLSEAALAVLEKARALDDGSGLVFPSPQKPGYMLSSQVLMNWIRETGYADRTNIHGLRSSFRDWCADTGKPRDIAEAALSHKVPGVEGAYFRSDLFQRRRRLMNQWAAYLAGERAKVVNMNA